MKVNVIDRGTALQMYLDWFNNFLAVPRFAEYYQISAPFAQQIIDYGRDVLHDQHYQRPNNIPVSIRINSNSIKVIR